MNNQGHLQWSVIISNIDTLEYKEMSLETRNETRNSVSEVTKKHISEEDCSTEMKKRSK